MSILILTSSISISTFATASEDISIEDFSIQLEAFLDESYQYSSSELIPDSGNISSDQIYTNRLIVSTFSNAPLENDYGAISKLEGFNNWHILQYVDEESANAAYEYFSTQSFVNYVEYDVLVDLDAPVIIEDTGNLSCWSTDVIETEEAFAFLDENKIEHNNEVIVAVIDSGVDETHFAFKDSNGDSRILTASREMDNTYDPENPQYYHGTIVAGAIIRNTKENIKIKSYNIFYQNTLYKDKAVASILAANILLAVKDGARVINLSVSLLRGNKTLTTTINRVTKNGIVVVASAGNGGTDASGKCPANIENCITVAAMDSEFYPWDGGINGSSNYGDVVDISAPGDNIVTTMPDGKYALAYATSMAAPFVSAAAAILKSIDPEMTSNEIVNRIKETAYVPDNWSEKCEGKPYGVGIVNFLNMVKAATTEVKPTITAKDGKIEMTAPAGSDSRIYYTLDGSIPTIDNHIVYTEPFSLSGVSVEMITAVCHENGKLIGEPVTTINHSASVYYKHSKALVPISSGVKMKWSSSNPNVASVDSSGRITGIAKGTAYIHAVNENGSEFVYKVTVDYSLWQEILIKLLFGFLWYI